MKPDKYYIYWLLGSNNARGDGVLDAAHETAIDIAYDFMYYFIEEYGYAYWDYSEQDLTFAKWALNEIITLLYYFDNMPPLTIIDTFIHKTKRFYEIKKEPAFRIAFEIAEELSDRLTEELDSTV